VAVDIGSREFGRPKVLIVGFGQPGHMGRYLASAAAQLGISYGIIDCSAAETRSRIERSFRWRFCDRKPGRMKQFENDVWSLCSKMQPDVVVATGQAPLERNLIEKLRMSGVRMINYSTDDPWNTVLHASWFVSALSAYDTIFTPRRANIDDFCHCGVRDVHYLPFGFDPEVHRPWAGDAPCGAASDVLFVGGCDDDRLPLATALIDAGLNVALFGGYWGRDAKTRPYWRGIADQDSIRSASATTRVCLCVGRRANRDGHAMRSFEAAAIGGCILAEDTQDHRELFGPDDHGARYFRSHAELVEQARHLVSDANARRRLASTLRETVAGGRHTYADRLATMLRFTVANDHNNSQRARSS
jgi:spore maturation protein CgeB